MDIRNQDIDQGKAFDWEREHRHLLEKIAPDTFMVLHYAAMAVLKLK